MEENLYKKLEMELNNFKEGIRDEGVDFAIEKAYEITAKQEIIDSIMYDQELSQKEISALLKQDSILDKLYSDWLCFDGNMREHINCSVDKSIDLITNNYKNKIKTHEK